MKRKDYEKPSMKVVILKQRAKLLQASGGLEQPDSFEEGGDPLNNS